MVHGMEKHESTGKVIDLTRKREYYTNGSHPRTGQSPTHTRVIAISSGKGGVGKTNIVANLGYSLSRLGRKVMILDADLGLGNLDVLLGMAPQYNLAHVVKGLKRIGEITVEGPGGMTILPASSGIQEMTKLTQSQKIKMLEELDKLIATKDILLIDTAAGISSNVMYFNAAAQEIIIVVSPEPTSLTDAYALIKVLSIRYGKRHFFILSNMVVNEHEGLEIYRQLKMVADRFLKVEIVYLGHIFTDTNIIKCVKKQKIISEYFPESSASRCFNKITETIALMNTENNRYGDSNFMWNNIFNDAYI